MEEQAYVELGESGRLSLLPGISVRESVSYQGALAHSGGL